MDKKAKGLKIEGRSRDADLYNLTRAWVSRLRWESCEYGGWVVDPKRPFGNSGDGQIADDILEIIGAENDAPTCPHCGKMVDEGRLKALHDYAHDLFADIPNGLLLLAKR